MEKKKWVLILKHVIYTVLFLFFYVLQTTPDFFRLFDVKPTFLIPMAICIAIFEGEFVGGIYGAFAGALCDMGSPTLFGVYGILLLGCCVVSGLLVIYLLRQRVTTALLLTLSTAAIVQTIIFFFSFTIWRYDGVGMLFLTKTLPGIFYTTLFTPFFYWMTRHIWRAFEKRLED